MRLHKLEVYDKNGRIGVCFVGDSWYDFARILFAILVSKPTERWPKRG